MKIGTKDLTWPRVARELSALLPQRKVAEADTSFTVKTNFRAFTPHDGVHDIAQDKKTFRDIDVNLLRAIARGSAGKKLSYRGFISSHLQQGPIDDNSKLALKRAVAIKKMLALVSKTIDDMRAIELRRISYSKG